MTSNFTKLSIVTAIFLGLASYSVLKNKDSNLFSERGNTFIENLPSKLNEYGSEEFLSHADLSPCKGVVPRDGV